MSLPLVPESQLPDFHSKICFGNSINVILKPFGNFFLAKYTEVKHFDTTQQWL